QWGAFGENLTTEGLLETTLAVGDKLQIGIVMFVVSQLRFSCFKLAGKFRSREIGKIFLESGRIGFYFAVLQEGKLQSGDTIKIVDRDPHHVTVREMLSAYNNADVGSELLEKATLVSALSQGWRDRIAGFLKARSG